jgi:hypothetical protein
LARQNTVKTYCIGIIPQQIDQIVTQGTNLRASFIERGKIEVCVDEALPLPKVLIPYKKQVHAEQRKASPYIKTIWDANGELDDCPIPVYYIEIDSLREIRTNFSKIAYINNICENGENQAYVSDDSVFRRVFGALYAQPRDKYELGITIETLDRFFRSNRSYHAEQQAGGGYYPRRTQNLRELIDKMLIGKVTVATYGVGEDGLTVQCDFDFDNHKGTNPAQPRVDAAIDHMKGLGIQPLLIASGSPDSYHVHIPILRTPIAISHGFIKTMHSELKQAHKDLNLKNDTETFPKQPDARHEKGNAMKLPLAVNRKSGKRAQLLDPDTKEPIDAFFITRVVELRQPEKEVVTICDRDYLPAPQLPAPRCVRSGTMRQCIVAALKEQLNGSEGHDMRIAIVCEAWASGKSTEEIVQLFADQDDFNEATTAKNVADIVNRGYHPWRCDTLRDRCASFVSCGSCSMRMRGVAARSEVVVEPAAAR